MCDGATDCKTAQTMIDSVYNPLSYADRLDQRSLDDVEMVVVHATELPDLATAREYGERVRYEKSGTGDSGHFYIDRDGTVQMWVAPDRVAHHVRGHNARSIDRKSTRLNSSHVAISYAVFCLKKTRT